MTPPHDTSAECEIFCFAALVDANNGTIYTDFTGKFPVRSYKGNQYIFLVYVYDANTILVRALKSRHASNQIEAFQDIYNYLIKMNFKPKLHVMDNECSKIIKEFIMGEQKINIQFVEAHQHRVNASERAIQTFKNHFIAGLCTVNENFPPSTLV